MRKGRVATVTDTQPHSDAAPVEFLFWFTVEDHGRFDFEVADDVPQPGPAIRVDAIVTELEALTQEWQELHDVIPSHAHRIALVPSLPDPTVTIDARLWPAIIEAASQPTVADLGGRFGLSDLDALRAARELVSTGIVELRPPDQRTPGSARHPREPLLLGAS